MNESKIKYSCADFTFPLLPHDKVLQLIKLLGIDAVDLGIFEDRSHNYPSTITKDPIHHGHKLTKQLQSLEMEAADVFLQTGAEPSINAANNPDRKVRTGNRELFKKMIEFAQALGCRHITGLPGVFHKGVDSGDDWNRALEEAQWRVETARSAQIIYSVEAHVGSILPNTEKTINFLVSCPDLTLTLDYGHFIYQGQTNESIHPLIPYASHFHARGGAKGKLQTIVKENEIDFSAILSEFKKLEYAGYICMEYVYQDWEGCNRTDNVSETLLLQEQLKKLDKFKAH